MSRDRRDRGKIGDVREAAIWLAYAGPACQIASSVWFALFALRTMRRMMRRNEEDISKSETERQDHYAAMRALREANNAELLRIVTEASAASAASVAKANEWLERAAIEDVRLELGPPRQPFEFPDYCGSCGAFLQGGATKHREGCKLLALIREHFPARVQ
jgi:hypothetical protein